MVDFRDDDGVAALGGLLPVQITSEELLICLFGVALSCVQAGLPTKLGETGQRLFHMNIIEIGGVGHYHATPNGVHNMVLKEINNITIYCTLYSMTPPQALMRSIKAEVRSEGVRKRAQRAREGKVKPRSPQRGVRPQGAPKSTYKRFLIRHYQYVQRFPTLPTACGLA